MSLSNYLEAKLLDHLTDNAAYTAPAALYLGLYTSAPSDVGGGTEVSGSGYAREAITFGAASGGTAASDAPVSFTASGGNWGTITHVGLFDASTSGNLLWSGAMSQSETVNDGGTLTFDTGDVTINLD